MTYTVWIIALFIASAALGWAVMDEIHARRVRRKASQAADLGDVLKPRVVWECPEPGCNWRLNTFLQIPGPEDDRHIIDLGARHYEQKHPGVTPPWELWKDIET